MGRFLIFQIILSLSSIAQGQNYLKNGSFERINKLTGDKVEYYSKNFYCKNWFTPTECSVDLYRSFDACDNKHFIGIYYHTATCVYTFQGDYCIGLVSIAEDGYMEHLTGRLNQPLEKGKLYKVSFAMRFWGNNPAFSKGFGYKFSSDSILFKSKKVLNLGSDLNRLSPYYEDLFAESKLRGDFQFDEYLTDTTWRQHATYYTAEGGEQFLTFGQFAFANDRAIIRQMNQYKSILSDVGRKKFLNSGKLSFLKRIDSVPVSKDFIDLVPNYYLLDDVRVELVTDPAVIHAQTTCKNGCVDSDPLTLQIPNRREVFIDRGYEGEMSFSIHADLQPQEKLVVELEKGITMTVVGGNLQQKTKLVYDFKYPAKKIRGKTIAYFVEKVTPDEIRSLNAHCFKVPLSYLDFKGWVFKCQNN